MIRPSLRLYLIANAFVYFIVGFWMFPEGFAVGFFAVLISSILSFPSLILLYGFFYLLLHYRPGVRLCWWLLCFVTAVCTVLPLLCIGFHFSSASGDDYFILTASIGSGFGSLLVQAQIIHRYFQRFQSTIK